MGFFLSLIKFHFFWISDIFGGNQQNARARKNESTSSAPTLGSRSAGLTASSYMLCNPNLRSLAAAFLPDVDADSIIFVHTIPMKYLI